MNESNDRIKRRVIALHNPDTDTLVESVKILSGNTGVEAVEPVKHGIRVTYRLQQTGFADLLAELHSNQIQESQNTLARMRFALVNFMEQQERDNLLSHDGWWQRVQVVHIDCQSREPDFLKNTQDRRHWKHYTDR